MGRSSTKAPPPPTECRAREVLDRVGDKWTLYVTAFLGQGPARFSELLRGIEGISQRMLTVTLRALERDGVLTRTVYEVMPPHVEYALTDRGESLLLAVRPLIEWSEANVELIRESQDQYDSGTGDGLERVS